MTGDPILKVVEDMLEQSDTARRFRLCVVNGVFVSGGIGDDGRVLPPRVFTNLAEWLEQETGMRAWAVWPYGSKRVFGIPEFLKITRREVANYAMNLARSVRRDLANEPLALDETLAFVAYSGGTPIVQAAAPLLREYFPISAFTFFGPALLPHKVPDDWHADARVGCVLGERDWIQGVFPRLPRPWTGRISPRARARIVATLPETTIYRSVPCDHWPGYFTSEGLPLLVRALSDLLQPAAVLA